MGIFVKTLEKNGLEIRKPIRTVVLMVSSARFVASAPKLALFLKTMGRTRESATAQLAIGIASQYRLLKCIPEKKMFPLHRKMLKQLGKYVREKKQAVCSKKSPPKKKLKTKKTRKK